MEPVIPSHFLPLIQLAITPVILLSGTGALMLTLTNRLGRVVDRTRGLAGLLRQATGDERAHLDGQLGILWRRALLVRLAVTLGALSMLFSCLLVVVILVDASLQREFGAEMIVTFVASIVCLTAALGAFIADIWVSLRALRIEVDRARTAE